MSKQQTFSPDGPEVPKKAAKKRHPNKPYELWRKSRTWEVWNPKTGVTTIREGRWYRVQKYRTLELAEQNLQKIKREIGSANVEAEIRIDPSGIEPE